MVGLDRRFTIFGGGDRVFGRIQCMGSILILAIRSLRPPSSFAWPVLQPIAFTANETVPDDTYLVDAPTGVL